MLSGWLLKCLLAEFSTLRRLVTTRNELAVQNCETFFFFLYKKLSEEEREMERRGLSMPCPRSDRAVTKVVGCAVAVKDWQRILG